MIKASSVCLRPVTSRIAAVISVPRARRSGEADLGGELAAVLAAAVELEALAHQARAGSAHVPAAVLGVDRAEALGDEHFHRFAEELFAGVTEEALGLGVDEHDEAVGADDDLGVGRGLDQILEVGVGGAALAEVLDLAHVPRVEDHDLRAIGGGADRAHRDVDRDRRGPGPLHRVREGRGSRVDRLVHAAPDLVVQRRRGDERRDRLAHRRGAVVTEEALGGAVPREDLARRRDRDEGVARVVDQRRGERARRRLRGAAHATSPRRAGCEFTLDIILHPTRSDDTTRGTIAVNTPTGVSTDIESLVTNTLFQRPDTGDRM
jgi:hypothetical protein